MMRKKGVMLSVRLSDVEWSIVHQVAADRGLSVSHYVRDCLMRDTQDTNPLVDVDV